MARIIWDEAGKRLYETGVSQGVHYLQETDGTYPKGVPWNGLTAITESPSGAEPTALYADNTKYISLYSAEDFGATVEAYTYPDEFAQCDGSAELVTGVTIGQQERKAFGMSYKTQIGNDIQDTAYGYKIHCIYGAKASPSERSNSTINDSPEAMTLSWEITTVPVNVKGFKPAAHLVIDSTKVDKAKLEELEGILYGAESTEPRLPLPDEIAQIIGGTTEG